VDADAADATVKQISGEGGRAVVEVVAVGTSEAADALVNRAVSEFGRLDVMVTNVGVLRDRVLGKMSDDDFDTVQPVQLRCTFRRVRAAAVRMREQGGHIIVAGSPAGQRGNFGQTNYAAAKTGIDVMVRTWATELAKAGITANAVSPTAATEMTQTNPAFAPHIEAYEADGPPFPDALRKGVAFSTAEDRAGLAVCLASEAARTSPSSASVSAATSSPRGRTRRRSRPRTPAAGRPTRSSPPGPPRCSSAWEPTASPPLSCKEHTLR
jgi:NAD(P)-dependent dehydrogenase (short-subunit alcohol dehydrogenase family)